ncbi:Uncharacterised protein [uncultured Clostridium sp.]|nr:Uncharacterised protein [uncultured Clostridium sp.]SCI90136.1 Uncharacterised protein [uncultured Clostridium sp.]
MKETRDLKITFTKGGSGSTTCKLGIPTKWVKELNITPEERDVEVTLSEDRIIIKKK